MRAEDVKIGQKVVPFQKTVTGYYTLDSTAGLKKALGKDIDYLFVIR